MRVLALDVATKTGYCTEKSSGVWDLSPKRDESKGIRLLKFKSKLTEVIEQEDITLVSFERTAGQYKSSLITQAEIHGVLKAYCEENSIDYVAFSATEIKKFATGKGNAPKTEMVKSVKSKYGITPIDDNHADAIHIYHYTLSQLG